MKHFKIVLTVISVFLTAFGILGCSSTLSSNIRTSGMYVSYSATHVSGESTAATTAIFQVGSSTGTYLSLDSGDSIACNGTVLNKETGLLGDISYTGSVAYANSGPYTFVFTRAGESAYTSVVTLPNAVTISSPANGATITKGAALPVAWNSSSSGSYLTIRLTKNLNTGSTSTYSDTESDETTTSYTIPAAKTTTEASGTISATIRVTRTGNDGTLSSSLSGSLTGSEADENTISLAD